MLAMLGCDPQEGFGFQSILDVEQPSIPKDSIFREGSKCHPQSAIEINRWLFFNLPVWENLWETQLFWKPRFRLPLSLLLLLRFHHFQWIVVVSLQFSYKPPAIVAGS